MARGYRPVTVLRGLETAARRAAARDHVRRRAALRPPPRAAAAGVARRGRDRVRADAADPRRRVDGVAGGRDAPRRRARPRAGGHDARRAARRRGARLEVGSHTCTHPWLPSCDDAALAQELTESKAALEQLLDVPLPHARVPVRRVRRARRRGDRCRRLRRGRDAAGACARLAARPVAGAAHERSRASASTGRTTGDRFRLKVSRPLRLVRRTRLWEAAPRVRRALARRTSQA